MQNNNSKIRVFITSTYKDRDLASALSKKLKEKGYKVWKDYDETTPGTNFNNEVINALENCNALIALLSPYSYSSEHVRTELETALSNDNFKERVLTVLIGKGTKENFKRIPWIFTRMPYVRIDSNEPNPASLNKVTNKFMQVINN